MHMNMNLLGMHLGRRNRWQDLPEGARKAIAIVGSAQAALLASAMIDLVRRPSSQVRGGRKWAWFPVILINGVGPLAYFAFGRRVASTDQVEATDRKRKRKKDKKSQAAVPWDM